MNDEDPRVDIVALALAAYYITAEEGVRASVRSRARTLLARLDAAAPVARDRRLDDLYAQAEAWVNENAVSRKAHPDSATHRARRVALEEAANTVLNVVEGRLTGLAEHYARQPAPAQPAVAVDTESAAPTRDTLAEKLAAELARLSYVRHTLEGQTTGFDIKGETPSSSVAKYAERMADVALAALRDGGADGGGEDGRYGEAGRWKEAHDRLRDRLVSLLGVSEQSTNGFLVDRIALLLTKGHDGETCAEVESERDSYKSEVDQTRVWLAKDGHEVNRDRHLGHDVMAAIRAGREPEVVTGAAANALPPGSIVSQWVNGRPVDALTHYFSGWARSGATRWGVHENLDSGSGAEWVVWCRAPEPEPEPPAPLTVGDELRDVADLRRAGVGAWVQYAPNRHNGHRQRALVTSNGVFDGEVRAVCSEHGEEVTFDNLVSDVWPMRLCGLPDGSDS